MHAKSADPAGRSTCRVRPLYRGLQAAPGSLGPVVPLACGHRVRLDCIVSSSLYNILCSRRLDATLPC